MFIVNGIAYAETSTADLSVQAVKPLDDMMLLLTFASGEKRLYDATQLLNYPAFQVLRDEVVFKAVTVDHGIVTYGDIDIAPETMYQNSFAYDEMLV